VKTESTYKVLRAAARALAVLITLVLSLPSAWGASSRQPDIGVRAIGMGGAFVAVGSDASSVNINPAAIASLQRQEFDLSYADRFGLGLSESYFSYILPVSDSHALGIDWFHRGFDDVSGGLGLKSGFDKFAIAYGYRNSIQQLKPYVGNAAIGVAAKYISQDVDLDGTSAMSASGVGLDLGLLVPLPHGVRLGLAVQDVGGTSVEHDGGFSEKIFDAHYKIGLAHKPIEGLTIAADLDDYARLGAEYWIAGQLALRAGLKTERDTPEIRGDATSLGFGLGAKYRYVQFDYAYERHPFLDATHYTSLSVSYNPRVVTIKDATIRPNPIFRSLYRHYQETDFVDIVIGNSAAEPIAADVRIMLPKVMSVPHTERVLLPAQSTEKYSFKVTFDSDLFNQPEAYFDNFVTPIIEVAYTRNRQEQVVEKQLERVYVAGKGKLSWNIDGMAAAFVTPADLAIAGVSRGLVQRYDDLLTGKFNRSNMGKAIVLFDAMGVYSLRYQADQKTPFANVSDDRTIFDTVQYPSELLFKEEGVGTKIGDCDDLTVLYASLLENLSIDTAFLEANDPGKGHIYLMFDSGIPVDRAEDHFVSSAEYVVWEGRVWIPVETTMFGFTFNDAWRKGVGEYKRLKARQLIDEVYVQQWMQTYKPAFLPPVSIELPAMEDVDSLLTRDIDFYDRRTDQIALGSVTSLDTPDGAYDAGVAYLRANHLEKALEMFDRTLSMKAAHADAINAKGVVFTKRARYDEALELFREALQLEENNGYRMNIALAYYLKGERETADLMFEGVVALDGSYADLFDFMASVGEAQEYYDVGVSYLRQVSLDKALEQFDLALQADSKYSEAVNAKGVVLCRQGRIQEALECFHQASQLEPEQLGFQLNIALAHHLLGDRKKADVIYQQVVGQDEAYDGLLDFIAAAESAKENYDVGARYMQQALWDKALERLDRAISADPALGDAYNSKGVVLARQGDLEGAIEAFQRAEELMPDNAGVRLNRAIIRHLQGRRHEAAVIYRQVIEMDSRYEGFLDILLETE
jgi:tetratricopeptide (TPR) repeat protein